MYCPEFLFRSTPSRDISTAGAGSQPTMAASFKENNSRPVKVKGASYHRNELTFPLAILPVRLVLVIWTIGILPRPDSHHTIAR